MTQSQCRDTQPKRRSVFDEISNQFGSHSVDPSAKINSSIAPPGSDEMFFGDLDFDADAAAFDFDEYDLTPNVKQATLLTESNLQTYFLNQSKEDCEAVRTSQSRNDVSWHDAHMKLRIEDCARVMERRS